jgi:hypothetical protein
MNSEIRHIVIITPTPTPGPDRTVDIEVSHDNPLEVDKTAKLRIYLKTYDTSTEDLMIRFHVTYSNQSHQWEDLGYTSLPLTDFLKSIKAPMTRLPAHSEMTYEYNPSVREIFGLTDGSKAKVYATVYRVNIDLIDKYDNHIVGSCDLGRVDVNRVDEYGHRRYDW